MTTQDRTELLRIAREALELDCRATEGPFTAGREMELLGRYHPGHIYGPDGETTIAHVYGVPDNCSYEELHQEGKWERGLNTARFLAAARTNYPKLARALIELLEGKL